uniref:Uncharacterized protein n=1 Tax=Oryza meridionalis TaxID=40149 RepID=A0A0E0ET01_9ORYZ
MDVWWRGLTSLSSVCLAEGIVGAGCRGASGLEATVGGRPMSGLEGADGCGLGFDLVHGYRALLPSSWEQRHLMRFLRRCGSEVAIPDHDDVEVAVPAS